MRTHRALLLAAAAFAVSLGGLSVAAMSAWLRCDRGADCSPDLALGIFGFAPAALLLAVVLLLLRKEASSAIGARIMLVVTLAVAVSPLAAFVVRDVQTLVIMALLFAALACLGLVDDQGWTSRTTGGHNIARPATASLVEPPPVLALPNLIERMVGAQDKLAAIIRDVRMLLPDESIASREGGLAHSDAWMQEPVADGSVVLALVGVRDFDDFVALYEALHRLPAVTNIVVRYYDGTCGLMQISLISPLLRPALIEALKHTSIAVAALPTAD
jgi:hypothetical protein